MRAASILIAGGFGANAACDLVSLAYVTFKKYGGRPLAQVTDCSERNQQIVSLYKEGKTLEEIGLQFCITRERVRQVIQKTAPGISGGAAVRAVSNQIEDARLRLISMNARCMDSYGCDYETARRLNDGLNFTAPKCRALAYNNQKRDASARGIEFRLSFPEWIEIWERSGKWMERGRGRNRYCMARHGDTGPYAVGNVYITTNAQNAAESYENTPVESRHHCNYVPRWAVTTLTPRQKQILELANSGNGPSAIAELLGIGRGTVAGILCTARAKVRRAKKAPILRAAA